MADEAPCRVPIAELDEAIRDTVGYEQDVSLRAALLAVLDVHKREHVDGYKGAKGWDHCASCRDTNWGGPDVDWPCETVEAIAEKLGIKIA